jgi:hypothetical protein
MKLLKTKHIIILLLSVFIFSSCGSKKKIFNGKTTLDCPEHKSSLSENETGKKKSKWRLVLYKDGSKVGGKTKRGKSRLFKNKK